MAPPRSRLRALVLVGVALMGVGCSGSVPPEARIDANAAAYRAGEPVFVLDAVASVRDDVPGVDVRLGLPPSSLVFRPAEDGLVAAAEWVVTVEQEGGAPRTRSVRDSLRVGAGEAARSVTPAWRAERFDVPPGRYLVRAVLEDLGSGRTAERQLQVVVAVPSEAPALGGLRLEGEQPSGEVAPVDVSAVPARLDSLRAVAQATGLPDEAVTVLTVLRLTADDAPARPMDDFVPLEGSLAARGVDASRVDTVQTVRQTLLNPADAVDVEAPVPPLDPGVYRAEIRVEAPGGERLDASERLFVVRRRDYPQVTRLGDLIGPLEYIARPGELDAITEADSPAAQRRAFDRFWGERLDDRRIAAAAVRAYYERVEEANRLFATYKEGWKTDQGMLYVLLGPPGFVEATPTGERWSYALGGAGPSLFVFERTAGRPFENASFSVLTFQRSRAYADLLRHVQRQWRSGVVP